MPMLLAKYLLSEFGKNPQITKLLNEREVFIAPIVNPDGHIFDRSASRLKMWRKNRRDNGNGSFGVDLNRNYSFHWGTGGSSQDTGSDTYMGAEAFSEPELKQCEIFF